MNHALIVLNVLVFLGTDVLLEAAQGGRGAAHEVKTRFMIDPQALSLPQFFTYQFLHGDFGHLFGKTVQGVTVVSPRMLAEELVRLGWI